MYVCRFTLTFILCILCHILCSHKHVIYTYTLIGCLRETTIILCLSFSTITPCDIYYIYVLYFLCAQLVCFRQTHVSKSMRKFILIIQLFFTYLLIHLGCIPVSHCNICLFSKLGDCFRKGLLPGNRWQLCVALTFYVHINFFLHSCLSQFYQLFCFVLQSNFTCRSFTRT